MNTHDVDGALKRTLRSRTAGAAGPCPDENLMAAYLEARLSVPEAAQLETHVSDCPACREVLALALKLSDGEPGPVYGPGEDGRRTKSRARLLYRLPLPLAAAGLLLALGVTLYRVLHEPPAGHRVESVADRAAGPPEKQTDQFARLKEDAAAPVISVAPGSDEKEPKTSPAPPAEVKESRENVDKADTARVAESRKSEPALLSDTSKSGRAVPAQPAPGKSQESLGAGRMRAVEPEPPAGQNAVPSVSRVGLQAARVPLVQSRMTGGAEALRDVLRIFALREPDPAEPGQRKSGSRTFMRFSGYWIDLGCAEHPDVPITEISRGTGGYESLLKEIPLLEELLDSGIPVVIYRDGIIYLVP